MTNDREYMMNLAKVRLSNALRLMKERGIPLMEYNGIYIESDPPNHYLGGHANTHHLRIATGQRRIGAEGDLIVRVALAPGSGFRRNDFQFKEDYFMHDFDGSVAISVTNREVYLERVIAALHEAGFHVAGTDTQAAGGWLVTHDCVVQVMD